MSISSSVNLQNVITVSPSNGDFTDLSKAITVVAAKASQSNPFLVIIGPGVYSVSATVKMAPYVTVRGSGIDVTILEGDMGSSGFDEAAAVVSLSDNSQLSSLTIRNLGSQQPCSIGVYINGKSTATLNDVQISATNALNDICAIYSKNSSPTISNSVIGANIPSNSSTNVYGLRTDRGNIKNTRIYSSGGNYAYGIYYSGQHNFDMDNCFIASDEGTQKSYCVFVESSGYIQARNSEILSVRTPPVKANSLYSVYVNTNGQSSRFFNCVVDGDVGGPGNVSFYASFSSIGSPL